MYVSEEYRFVYMAPKKTGSTSMRTLLAEEYGAIRWRDYPDRNFTDESVSPDWRSEGPDWKHVCHLPERFSDYFIFATIRNPYTLEISRYHHDLRHKYIEKGFSNFIHRLVGVEKPPTLKRKLHQVPEYSPPRGCVRFDLHAVVRLEQFDADFRKLPFYKPGSKLPHLHQSLAKAPVYTTALARIVRKAYREDFDTFGYDPNSWVAEFCISLL